MKTIYDALFGKYIGKEISLSDEGYYIGGDWVPGRYYTGTLKRVTIERDRLVFILDRSREITVDFDTKIEIIKEG